MKKKIAMQLVVIKLFGGHDKQKKKKTRIPRIVVSVDFAISICDINSAIWISPSRKRKKKVENWTNWTIYAMTIIISATKSWDL